MIVRSTHLPFCSLPSPISPTGLRSIWSVVCCHCRPHNHSFTTLTFLVSQFLDTHLRTCPSLFSPIQNVDDNETYGMPFGRCPLHHGRIYPPSPPGRLHFQPSRSFHCQSPSRLWLLGQTIRRFHHHRLIHDGRRRGIPSKGLFRQQHRQDRGGHLLPRRRCRKLRSRWQRDCELSWEIDAPEFGY